MSGFLKQMEDYWSKRAISYSEQHIEELNSDSFKKWQDFILQRVDRKNKQCKVLDIGTGPGFLAIVVASLGFEVTAIDMTSAMLTEAQNNALKYRKKINFFKMDATNLDFADETFDLIITRNVTWNLENLATTYQEWLRILKSGGQLLNFDANWYNYLFDSTGRKEYDKVRCEVQTLKIKDYYAYQDAKQMEDLAKQLKTSKYQRPAWDLAFFKEKNVQKIEIIKNLNDELLTDEQKINFAFTPIFCIDVIK